MNELVTQTLNIVSPIITAVVAIYLNSRVKNLADKQDLEDVTRIVESIKKASSEEIELLKSNLALQNNKKVILFSDEKKTIIDFYSALNSWIWDIISIHLSEYTKLNYDSLSERITQMRANYYIVNIELSKLEVTVMDADIITEAHKVRSQCLSLHHEKEMNALSTVGLLKEEKALYDEYLATKRLGLDSEESDYAAQLSSRELKESKKEIREEDHISQSETWSVTIESVQRFNALAKKYIKDEN